MKTVEELWEARELEACDVDRAYEDAAMKRQGFLEKRGWDYTCDTPGSFWMFVKVVKGVHLCVNAAIAFDWERRFIEPLDTGESSDAESSIVNHQ